MKFAPIFRRTTALAFVLLAGIVAATEPAVVFARPAHRNVVPNPALLAALVAVGGGQRAFSAKTLRERLGGSTEDTKLRSDLGAESVRRYDEVFTFAVRDGLTTMKRSGATLPLPAPGPLRTKAVATALFEAGLDDGTFDIERLFDTLFSPNVHMHAMMAVAQKYGAAGESAYHRVFERLIADVSGNSARVSGTSTHRMEGMSTKSMDMKGMNVPSPTATRPPFGNRN